MTHEMRLLLVMLIWGCNYWVLPHGVGPMGPGPFTLVRFAFTFPVLALLVARRRSFNVQREDRLRLAVFGVIGIAGYQAVFAAAVAATTTTNAAILFSLSPLFGVLIGLLTGRDRPGLLNVVGLLMAFVGGAILVLQREPGAAWTVANLWGDLLMVMAALLWALAAFVAEPALKKYGGLVVTACSLPSGLVGLMLWAGPDAMRVDWRAVPEGAWAALGFAVLFATVLGVVLFYDAVPHMGSGRVMSYMYLTPVTAIMIACILNREWLTLPQCLGIVLAMVGVALARRCRRPDESL